MSQLQQRLTGVSIPLGVSHESWSEWLLRLRRRFRRRHNPAGMPDFLMLLASCLRGGAGSARAYPRRSSFSAGVCGRVRGAVALRASVRRVGGAARAVVARAAAARAARAA